MVYILAWNVLCRGDIGKRMSAQGVSLDWELLCADVVHYSLNFFTYCLYLALGNGGGDMLPPGFRNLNVPYCVGRDAVGIQISQQVALPRVVTHLAQTFEHIGLPFDLPWHQSKLLAFLNLIQFLISGIMKVQISRILHLSLQISPLIVIVWHLACSI